ncbi:MAG TPA: hypothetical protein VIM85_02555 [Pseudomonadales bacterium]
MGAVFEPIEIGTIDLITWDKGAEDWSFDTAADSDALFIKVSCYFTKSAEKFLGAKKKLIIQHVEFWRILCLDLV